MLNRSITLPMGMLFTVDLNIFIKAMVDVATEENPAFDLKTVMPRALQLCEQFNQDRISEDDFCQKILSLLDIQGMTSEQFWINWNAVLKFDGLLEKTNMLQKLSRDNNVLFNFTSDTNIAHLRHIQSQNIDLTINESEAAICGFPLYLTCLLKKDHFAVITHAVEKVKNKAFNPVQEPIVLLGDPSNQPVPLRQRAQGEVEKITRWGNENGAKVQLHSQPNTLQQTLECILGIVRELTSTPTAANM